MLTQKNWLTKIMLILTHWLTIKMLSEKHWLTKKILSEKHWLTKKVLAQKHWLSANLQICIKILKCYHYMPESKLVFSHILQNFISSICVLYQEKSYKTFLF